jgi:hypothetical protein
MEFGRVQESELDILTLISLMSQRVIKEYWVERKRKMSKYISAAPNGEDQNGLENLSAKNKGKKFLTALC